MRKYSPEGTRVGVQMRGQFEAIELTVHNDGNPIAPDTLKNLFQPMQRATTDVHQAGRSIGLGLYIVDQIVQAHGGTIDVTSAAEAGTHFTVRLPRTAPVSQR